VNLPAVVSIRRLVVEDLSDYKALRDEMLAAFPEAFTSDAETEALRPAASYLGRLGIGRLDGGHFTLGAWRATRLLGAIGCEREPRLKVRHIGHIIGMMVRPEVRGTGLGAALLDACIAEARRAQGLELLTLSVSAGNLPAVRLYERAGFVRYGTLARAIRLGERYLDKDLMSLAL
jgi:ribosomal protein S18 acetylase RimI-like enzyme